jgi:hypothetical protein
MKYRIKPKRDFTDKGFWIDGKWVRSGFVVTDAGGMTNVMPAATWFRTVADAMRAIQIWERVQHNATEFWIAIHRPIER